MLISTDNISVGEVLDLERKGYRVIMDADSSYAEIVREQRTIKEDKNVVETTH